MCNTVQIIRHCIRQQLPIVLVLNKIDRLVLELRLPPNESILQDTTRYPRSQQLHRLVRPNPDLQLGPERGNVAFASTQMGYCFTLRSFAKLYAETYGAGVDVDAFAQRLWGNIYYNAESRNFSRTAPDAESKRSFVHFILEPLYKIYSAVLSSDTESLKRTLAKLGIRLKPAVYKIDVRPLLKIVLNQFFGPSQGFVDLVVDHVPSPREAAEARLAKSYTGPASGPIYSAMRLATLTDPLSFKSPSSTRRSMVWSSAHLVALCPVPPARVAASKFSVKPSHKDDEEDMSLATIESTWINETRYVVPTEGVPAGNWVLLSGVDASLSKTGTIVDASLPTEDLHIFAPLSNTSLKPYSKSPSSPSTQANYPRCSRAFADQQVLPFAVTKVEESGEHVIMGTGELYLDCILHDLRVLFSEIEIRVSDPVVRFCETVVETSAVKCYASTPNKRNKLTIIAEPLEKGLAEDIESGVDR